MPDPELEPYRKTIDVVDWCAVHSLGLMGQAISTLGNPELATASREQFSSFVKLRFIVTDMVGEVKLRRGDKSVISPERRDKVFENVVGHNQEFAERWKFLIPDSFVLGTWKYMHEVSVSRQEAQKRPRVSRKHAA